MNISRHEQRALHVLALGGHILHMRHDGRKVTEVLCLTREGLILSDCTLRIFQSLRRKGLIESSGGSPYRISLAGRRAVRAQVNNRG